MRIVIAPAAYIYNDAPVLWLETHIDLLVADVTVEGVARIVWVSKLIGIWSNIWEPAWSIAYAWLCKNSWYYLLIIFKDGI